MKTAEEEKMYSILAECNHTSKSHLYRNRNIGVLTAPLNSIKAMKLYALEITAKKDELIEAQRGLIRLLQTTAFYTTDDIAKNILLSEDYKGELIQKIEQLENELK